MDDLLLYRIEKIKDGKVVKVFTIYITGDLDVSPEEEGVRYSISNNFPHQCHRVGISMNAFSPNIDVRDEAEPSS